MSQTKKIIDYDQENKFSISVLKIFFYKHMSMWNLNFKTSIIMVFIPYHQSRTYYLTRNLTGERFILACAEVLLLCLFFVFLVPLKGWATLPLVFFSQIFIIFLEEGKRKKNTFHSWVLQRWRRVRDIYEGVELVENNHFLSIVLEFSTFKSLEWKFVFPTRLLSYSLSYYFFDSWTC